MSSSTTFSLSVALIQTFLFWNCLTPNMNAAEVPCVCSQSLVYVIKLSHDGVAGCSFVWANILDKMIFPLKHRMAAQREDKRLKWERKMKKILYNFLSEGDKICVEGQQSSFLFCVFSPLWSVPQTIHFVISEKITYNIPFSF